MSDIKTENLWLMKGDCLERSLGGVNTCARYVRQHKRRDPKYWSLKDD